MNVLIAAAWPYASGPRHLGHLAGVYVPADVAARWHRLRGDDVLFVSGSDQYGTPITIAAEQSGEPVAEFAHRQHRAIAATFDRIGITFDHYGETATEQHATTVHNVFHALHRNNLFDEVRTPTAWCPQHQRSLPDRYVEGGCPRCGADGARGDQCDACGALLDAADLVAPRCRRCGSATELRLQRNLRIRLDRLQSQITAYAADHLTTRPFAREETLALVRTGLQPRAVTRDLDWGVTVPLDSWDDRRLYVWFDAVVGYLSTSLAARPTDWQRWWCETESTARHRYFVGKDNVWFHTVWWPAILTGSGLGLHLPDEVVASHHLLQRGEQLSSSRAHGETADSAIDRVGSDALRHALIALAPETADVDFTWPQADATTRTGLLGSIANPAHRVASLIWQRFGGVIDAPTSAPTHNGFAAVGDAINNGEFRRALAAVHDIGKQINQRLAADEPWHLPNDQARRSLSDLIPLVDALATTAWPFVPQTAENIRTTYGRPPRPNQWGPDNSPALVSAPPKPPLPSPGAHSVL